MMSSEPTGRLPFPVFPLANEVSCLAVSDVMVSGRSVAWWQISERGERRVSGFLREGRLLDLAA